MKNQVIVIPYGDNDYAYTMTLVGELIVTWRKNLTQSEDFDEDFNLRDFIHKTMQFVLDVKYPGSSEEKFKRLTKTSSTNIYIDEEADKYLDKHYPDGDYANLRIDFRLSEEKQVEIF